MTRVGRPWRGTAAEKAAPEVRRATGLGRCPAWDSRLVTVGELVKWSDLRSWGPRISEDDIWIAACCLERGLR